MKKLVLLLVLLLPSIALAQPGRLSPQGGTITEVVAGTGLTGGGTSGSVTVNFVCGTGLVCAADSVSVSGSYPTGSGTTDFFTKWTGTSTQGNAPMKDNIGTDNTIVTNTGADFRTGRLYVNTPDVSEPGYRSTRNATSPGNTTSNQWGFGYSASSTNFVWDYFNGSAWNGPYMSLTQFGNLSLPGSSSNPETTLTLTNPTASGRTYSFIVPNSSSGLWPSTFVLYDPNTVGRVFAVDASGNVTMPYNVVAGSASAASQHNFNGRFTLQRDDGGVSGNRPSLTITNLSSAGAINHYSELNFIDYDSGAVQRTHQIQGIGSSLYILPATNLIARVDNGSFLIQNANVDSNATMKIINDVQTWQIATRGADRADALTFRNETAGADAFMLTTGNNFQGLNDGTYFAWDASLAHVGITKKVGSESKLTYGSTNDLCIAQSSTSTIAAGSTYTDRFCTRSSGAVDVPIGPFTVGGTTLVSGTLNKFAMFTPDGSHVGNAPTSWTSSGAGSGPEVIVGTNLHMMGYQRIDDFDTGTWDGATVGSTIISRDQSTMFWTGGVTIGQWSNGAVPAFGSTTGTLNVAGSTWIASTAGAGASGELNVGADTSQVTTARNGWKLAAFSDGNLYLDHKVFSGGTINYRYGSGAQSGANNSWMTLTPSTATTALTGSLTISNNLTAGDTPGSDGPHYINGRQSTAIQNGSTGAPLTTSAAEFNVSSNSMVTIGESVAANANPAITLYRTSSGFRTGTGARLYLASSNFDFRIQQGTNNVAYGTETYTDRMKIDANGAVLFTPDSGGSIAGVNVSGTPQYQFMTSGDTTSVFNVWDATNPTALYINNSGAAGYANLEVSGSVNTSNSGNGGYKIDGILTMYRSSADGHLYIKNPYNVAGAGSYHIIVQPSSTQGYVWLRGGGSTDGVMINSAGNTHHLHTNTAGADVADYFGATTIGYGLSIAGYNNNDGTGVLWHNAYSSYSTSSGGTALASQLRWRSTHGTFGSRGIAMTYIGTCGQDCGGIGFYADSVATTAGATFTPTLRMLVQNNGNVGIGTSSADAPLQVAYDYASTPTIKVGAATNAAGYYSFLGNDISSATIGYLGNAYNNNDSKYQVRMKGTAASNAVFEWAGNGMSSALYGLQSAGQSTAMVFAGDLYTPNASGAFYVGRAARNLFQSSDDVWETSNSCTNVAGGWAACQFGTTVTYARTFTASPRGVNEWIGQLTTSNTANTAWYGERLFLASHGIRDVRNRTFTFSIWAKAASGTPQLNMIISRDPTADGGGGACTLSTTWQRCVVHWTFGNTAAADGDNSQMLVYMLPINTTIQVSLWGAQLEEGNIATPYVAQRDMNIDTVGAYGWNNYSATGQPFALAHYSPTIFAGNSEMNPAATLGAWGVYSDIDLANGRSLAPIADTFETGRLRKNGYKNSDAENDGGSGNDTWIQVEYGSTIAYTTATQVSPRGVSETVGQVTCTNGGTACTSGGHDYRYHATSASHGVSDVRGQTWTASAWYKLASGVTYANIGLIMARYGDADQGSGPNDCVINNQTWTRCSVTRRFNTTSLTDNSMIIFYQNFFTTTAVYVYGAQLEQSPEPTDYQKNDGTLASAYSSTDRATWSSELRSGGTMQHPNFIVGTGGTTVGALNQTWCEVATSGILNDWNPTCSNGVTFANSTAVMVTPTLSTTVEITGIAGGVDGRTLTISNVENSIFVKVYLQHASSTAANRVIGSYGDTVIFIYPGTSATFVYRGGSLNRWQLTGLSTSDYYKMFAENYLGVQGTWEAIVSSRQINNYGSFAGYEQTPATSAVNLDNYDPGNAMILRMAFTAADKGITGFLGGRSGRMLWVVNVGSNYFTLENENTASSAANRFTVEDGTADRVDPGEVAFVMYDSTTTRWHVRTHVFLNKQTSPASVSGTLNDWAPVGGSTAGTIRVTETNSVTINGLALGQVAGRRVKICPLSGYPISFTNEAGTSTAANRFSLPNATWTTSATSGNGCPEFEYDGTSSRWRLVSWPDYVFPIISTTAIAGNVTFSGTETFTGPSVTFNTSGDLVDFKDGPRGINRYEGNMLEWTEEFIGHDSQLTTTHNATKYNDQMYVYLSGTGATMTSVSPIAGRPGVVEWSTGTTNAGFVYLHTDRNLAQINDGSKWYMEATVAFPTLSTSAEEYIARVGFLSIAPGDDHCYLAYDRGGCLNGCTTAVGDTWIGHCMVNGSDTSLKLDGTGGTTNSPVAAGTYYRVMVAWTASNNVEFWINGTQRGTLTTGIPSGAADSTGAAILLEKKVGTTARTMRVDQYTLRATLATRNP